MTEKSYGGNTGINSGKAVIKPKLDVSSFNKDKKIIKKEKTQSGNKDKEKALEVGKIASQVKAYAKTIIKKNIPLLEIAEKIENKIIELGGKPAFPVNLSINDIAAHYTPSYNDFNLANGLLKIDLGVHIDGIIADTAFSIDLENNQENKKLIEAAEKALEAGIKKAKLNILVSEIGKEIQKTIESFNFTPIINLSGHGIDSYDLHSGINIPNIGDNQKNELSEGLFAIEPFATLSSGTGKVYDGRPSEIYSLLNPGKGVRNQTAREILEFIAEEYQTLPFCSRWLVKKFGTRALIGLRELEQANVLHRFPELIESSHSKVSQAEHTILVEKNKIIVTTE